jgi:hypothetical protein
MFKFNPAILIFCTFLTYGIACSIPQYQIPIVTSTNKVEPTRTVPTQISVSPLPSASPASINTSPAVTSTSRPLQSTSTTAGGDICSDHRSIQLINDLKSALSTSDGSRLASLVSPAHGMEARLFRDGRIVTYDQEHARFLFDSKYQVNWGLAPGSGLEIQGSFQALMVPALLDVLTRDYSLSCNQVKTGGASYRTNWPYPGIDFYSVYWPGTQANGNLDWHTWLLGMQYVAGKPYLYAIMQFQWEP